MCHALFVMTSLSCFVFVCHALPVMTGVSCFVFFDTLLTVGTNLWLQHDIDRWDKPFGCAGRWDKPFGTT